MKSSEQSKTIFLLPDNLCQEACILEFKWLIDLYEIEAYYFCLRHVAYGSLQKS